MRLALGTDWSFRLRAASVQFSRSVMSDSLLSHGLQHIRLPCPAPTPRTCSNSWLHSQSFLHNLCKQGDIFSLPSSCLSPFFPSSFLLFFYFIPSFVYYIYLYVPLFCTGSLGWLVVCLWSTVSLSSVWRWAFHPGQIKPVSPLDSNTEKAVES